MTVTAPANRVEMFQQWRHELLSLNLLTFEPDSQRTAVLYLAPQFLENLFPETTLTDFIPQHYAQYTGIVNDMGIIKRARWRNQVLGYANTTRWMAQFTMHNDGFTDETEERLRAAIVAHRKLSKTEWMHVAHIRMNLASLFAVCDGGDALEGSLYDEDHYLRMDEKFHAWLPIYMRVLAGELMDIKF